MESIVEERRDVKMFHDWKYTSKRSEFPAFYCYLCHVCYDFYYIWIHITLNSMNYSILLEKGPRLVMLFSLLFLSSCSGEEVSKEEQPVPDEVIISAESSSYFTDGMSFDSDAGNNSIHFTTNQDWNVGVASADWCIATPTNGKAGEATFSISVSENANTAEREALVTLVAGTVEKTITVRQEGAPVELNLSEESADLFAEGFFCSADGNSRVVTFTVNCDWEVVVEGGDSWCSVEPQKGESGNAMFTVVVGENAHETVRTATVTLKAGSISQKMTVTQEEKAPSGVTGGSEDYDEEQGTWDE